MAQQYINKIERLGYRMTAPRLAVLKALTTFPQSVQELSESIAHQGRQIDLVTIYRNVELFEKLGLVHQTHFADQVARYELVNEEKDHHHHLVCEECGRVEDIVVDEHPLQRQLQRQTSFKITRHILEFFGVCRQCQ